MGTICVLKTAYVEPEPDRGRRDRGRRRGAHPVSLLAFLQAENTKLENVVAQLRRDTTALRQALQQDR
jgi:hypothetical protein